MIKDERTESVREKNMRDKGVEDEQTMRNRVKYQR